MWDYSYIAANSGAILDQIYSCQMPPQPGSPYAGTGPSLTVTEAERQIMLTWLVCGAPNN